MVSDRSIIQAFTTGSRRPCNLTSPCFLYPNVSLTFAHKRHLSFGELSETVKTVNWNSRNLLSTGTGVKLGVLACCAAILVPLGAFLVAGGTLGGLASNLGLLAPSGAVPRRTCRDAPHDGRLLPGRRSGHPPGGPRTGSGTNGARPSRCCALTRQQQVDCVRSWLWSRSSRWPVAARP